MKYNRYLVFAWSLSEQHEGIVNDNPLDKIRATCETEEEANRKTLELLEFDFISIFDCQERKTISEIDNLPL